MCDRCQDIDHSEMSEGVCWGCHEPTAWVDINFEAHLCPLCYQWKWKEFARAYNREPFRVAIVGSRNFPDLGMVTRFIEDCLPRDATIISGGARGVDSWAVGQAQRLGMATEVFPADWEQFGKRAGFIRNQQIVIACDVVVAFWDGKSKGTQNTLDLMAEAGKPVRIFTPKKAAYV